MRPAAFPPMPSVRLGRTGIEVSRLCFGTLTLGPLQRNMTPDEGGSLLAEAYEAGIRFVDTAELYGTYAHVRRSIELSGIRPVIAARSYAYDAEGARRSFEKALDELGVDRIDLFLMHEQESEHTIRGHWEAFEWYLGQKRAGAIGAVGLSTHHIACVRAAAAVPEIDVIHPITNLAGLGICDGTKEEMAGAILEASRAGKGIYGMKAFGGGNLLHSWEACMRYALGLPGVDALAVGMQSREELFANLSILHGLPVPEAIASEIRARKKRLHVDFWCEGCGRCVDRCGQKAIRVVDGVAVPDPARCVLCGYCASVCPVFAIKAF